MTARTLDWPLVAVPEKDVVSGSVSIGRAERILGSERVCSAKDVNRVWERNSKKVFSIPFLLQTLEECAAENAAGQADWRLTFCAGMTFGGMYAARGESSKKQPCFHPEPFVKQEREGSFFQATHILNETMRDGVDWLAEESESGYVLTDFTPRFKGLSWDEQERCIRARKKSVRTHDRVFTEMVMSIFMIKDIRLASNWFHWGITKSHGYHLCVGRNIPHGLVVKEGWAGAGLSVVMDRVPDH